MTKRSIVVQAQPKHPAKVEGWLNEDNPFFTAIDEIVEARFQHRPRSETALAVVEAIG